MDAAVRNQPLDRLLGDLAAVRIEAGQDDRARRVVDDQVDAGRQLERADVAAFAADDPPLEIVAGQVDDRDRGLDRVLGAAALDRLGDVLLGAIDRGLARFGVEPLQQVGRVVACLAFNLLDQQLLGLVGGQPGDALELVLVLGDELLALRERRGGVALAIAQRLVAACQLLLETIDRRLAVGRRRLAAGQRLLHRRRLLAVGAGLTLRLHQDVVRLFLRLEQRFFLAGFGVACGVLGQAQRLFLGASDGVGGDAFAVGDPDRRT